MSERIQAPWDATTIRRLNDFQLSGRMHPMTCPTHSDYPLVARWSGWYCPWCKYTQIWAHDWMAKDESP